MLPLRYVPFETVVDAAFWLGLANRKLNEYRLSEGPFAISAQYCNDLASDLSPRVSVDITSFTDSNVRRNMGPSSFTMHGQMILYNSLDEFKNVDKQMLINKYGSNVINKSSIDNQFFKDPDCLHNFLLITYCDLKTHKFYFWFAYPAILHSFQPKIITLRRLDEEFTTDQISQFLFSYSNWRKNHTSSVFIVRADSSLSTHSFIDFSDSSSIYIGFCDSSTDEQHPSWLLRNILYSLCAHINEKQTIKFICFRDRYVAGKRVCEHSLVLYLELEPIREGFTNFVGWEKWKNQIKPRVVDLSSTMDPVKLSESAVDLNLKLMKWRLMPDLKLSLFRSTTCLLIGAGTLGCNVARQLLSWGIRTITFVDNSTVSHSNPIRQSLYVFNDSVDSGKSKAVAAAKALVAIFPGVSARGIELSIPMPGHQIKETGVIQSNTNAQSELENLHVIPTFVDATKKCCEELDNLVRSHDVIFLLTDTRESRWLPTLLANIHGKLVINAALGFDTYLVMRHGLNSPGLSPSFTDVDSLIHGVGTLASNISKKKSKSGSGSAKMLKIITGSKLGCYFCNDVVGPMNSTRNRSLDQQCTVTRPGVSMIAAALAVELMISVLQHPLGFGAAADTLDNQDSLGKNSVCSSLGLVPHQIRGFLSHHTQVLPATMAFSKCSACSQSVLNAYKTSGFDFLLRVFNDSTYLEHVCGLYELHNELDDNAFVMLSDSD